MNKIISFKGAPCVKSRSAIVLNTLRLHDKTHFFFLSTQNYLFYIDQRINIKFNLMIDVCGHVIMIFYHQGERDEEIVFSSEYVFECAYCIR